MTDRASHLVVAFNFAPFTDGSAVTIAKRIVEAGHLVDVISADLSTIRTADDQLQDFVGPYIGEHAMVRPVIRFAAQDSLRDFTKRGLAVAEARRLDPYETVYSRSMWPHSHFLAAHIRARGLADRWTAEFSDPVLWHVDGEPRPSGPLEIGPQEAALLRQLGTPQQRLLRDRQTVLAWTQFLPFFLADQIVFTNEQQRTVMLNDLPEALRNDAFERSTVSEHPTPPAELYEPAVERPRDDTRFRIGYFGTFYANRGAADFLEALSMLTDDERKQIVLDVYAEKADDLRRAARALDVMECVNIRKPLPYREFLRQSNSYDALLVTDIATSPFSVPSPFLPSKYSDYAGSRTPIFSISITGSPLDAKTTKWRAEIGNSASIRRSLAEMAKSVHIK